MADCPSVKTLLPIFLSARIRITPRTGGAGGRGKLRVRSRWFRAANHRILSLSLSMTQLTNNFWQIFLEMDEDGKFSPSKNADPLGQMIGRRLDLLRTSLSARRANNEGTERRKGVAPLNSRSRSFAAVKGWHGGGMGWDGMGWRVGGGGGVVEPEKRKAERGRRTALTIFGKVARI